MIERVWCKGKNGFHAKRNLEKYLAKFGAKIRGGVGLGKYLKDVPGDEWGDNYEFVVCFDWEMEDSGGNMIDKQVLIVRQSCLKAAVDLVKPVSEPFSVKLVCELAAKLEKWVFRE